MASGAAQRAIGVGQIIGGALYALYGGAYGGSGGGGYLISQGIANAGGSKYGSARRGTTGFYQDLYGSLGAAGASFGLGGRKKQPAEEEAFASPYLKALMTQPRDYVSLQQEPANEPFSAADFGYDPTFQYNAQPTPLRNDISQPAPGGSNIFGGLRNLLLGEYA